MKIRPVGAELFRAGLRAGGRADGWTDMKKLIVAFRNFASAPKTSSPASEIKKILIFFPHRLYYVFHTIVTFLELTLTVSSL